MVGSIEIKNTKPFEKITSISIHADYTNHHVMIGTELTDGLRSTLTNFLKRNFDVFAWSQGDVLDIDPQVATQKLFTNPEYPQFAKKKKVCSGAPKSH